MTEETTESTLQLTTDQSKAYEALCSSENVFLTGGAGSGKSYLIKYFMQDKINPQTFPLLASTGAAAVLIGGRTFHSFFGLGIMEGGAEATWTRLATDNRVLARIRKVDGVIIDEISMIPGVAFEIAERLARKAKGKDLPWGGLRIICVGDFAQLPPVTQTKDRDWCFLNPTWEQTQFSHHILKINKRVESDDFLEILKWIRWGRVNNDVIQFLNQHIKEHDENDLGTRLFPRRQQAEDFNNKKLKEIPKDEIEIHTIYMGEEKFIQALKKNSPLPETLKIKEGCRVMLIQNDPQRKWVNGSQGKIISYSVMEIKIKLDSGRTVKVEKNSFSLQDPEGNVKASALNFPLVLSYATTIHKSQGATLDKIWVDLRSLWEPGQAYVALSRLRSADGLNLIGWSPSSIKIDPAVFNFYKQIVDQKI